MIKDIDNFDGLNITINTTEDCNLRCKYCYEINKKPRSIKYEDCVKFIDLIFDTDNPANVPEDQIESFKSEWRAQRALDDDSLYTQSCQSALPDDSKKNW